MEENATTITVHDSQGVGYVGCYLVINGKETYKIIAVDGNTLTIAKPNIFSRIWDSLVGRLQTLKWKAIEMYYEAVEWIQEKINAIRAR